MKKAGKKAKPEFNENIHYSPTEMKRYLGALCETHDESLKAINENFFIVNRKLDEHTKILDGHTKKLDEHTKILDGHTKKLDSHSEMIGSLMENMEIVKGDISVIKGDLKKKVDYDDFLSLVRRVQKIEAKI